jgi:hypothetical protein
VNETSSRPSAVVSRIWCGEQICAAREIQISFKGSSLDGDEVVKRRRTAHCRKPREERTAP